MLTESTQKNLKTEKTPFIEFHPESSFSKDDLPIIAACLAENTKAVSLSINQTIKGGLRGYIHPTAPILSDPDNILFKALISHPSILHFWSNITLEYYIEAGYTTLPRKENITSKIGGLIKKISEKLELKRDLFKAYDAFNNDEKIKEYNEKAEAENKSQIKHKGKTFIFTQIENLKNQKYHLGRMKIIQQKEPLLPDLHSSARKMFFEKLFASVKTMTISAITSFNNIPSEKKWSLLEKLSNSENRLSSIKEILDGLIKAYKPPFTAFLLDVVEPGNAYFPYFELRGITQLLDSFTKEELAYTPIPRAETTLVSENRYLIHNMGINHDSDTGPTNENNGPGYEASNC